MPAIPVSNSQPSMALTQSIVTSGPATTQLGPAGGLFLDQILTFAFGVNPRGTVEALGQLLSVISYSGVAAAIGTTYGGSGNFFALPNLNDVTMIGAGTGTGLAAQIVGQRTGSSAFTLTNPQLPLDLGGTGQPVDNHQPSLPITYMICVRGVYPALQPMESGAARDLIGSIAAFAGNYVPTDYLPCDGRLLSIAQNTALFSQLGTTYGGDGTTTFALPDLRGRTIIGASPDYPLGTILGADTISLSNQQAPHGSGNPVTPFSNLQPSLALNYMIALDGQIPYATIGVPNLAIPYVGEVVAFANANPPRGFSACDGKLLPIASFPDLYSVIGATYGGDGVLTFALPDLSGREVIGSGAHAIGQIFGTDATTIALANLPPVNVPAPGSPALTLDTGTSSTDGISRTGSVSLSGIVNSAAVEYSVNGGATWTSAFSAVQGDNSLRIRQTNVLGTVSASSQPFHFTFDSVALAPTIALASDTGSSSADSITSKGALALGGVEAGATAEYSIDNGATWMASFTPTQGTNSVKVRQTDIAGNISAASAAFKFTLAAPTVAIVDIGPPVAGMRTITGMAELANAGTSVKIFDGATQVGSAIVGVNGLWSANITPAGTGPHVYSAANTDAAGATGTSTAAVTAVNKPLGGGAFETDVYDAQNHLMGITRYNAASVRTDAYAYDASGHTVLVSHFDASGNITSWESLFAGTDNVQELIVYGIAGQAYTGFDYVYSPQGALVSRNFYSGAHVPLSSYNTAADGSRHERFYAANGTSQDTAYDALNHKTAYTLLNAAGHVTDSYGYDAVGNYTSISHYDAAGALTSAQTFTAGTATPTNLVAKGLNGIDAYDGNKTYNAMDLNYTATGNTRDITLHFDDGTNLIQAAVDGVKLTSLTGADDLLRGGQNETYVFHYGFGHDTLSGFNVAGAGHDVLQFDASIFSAGNANADFVLSKASQVGSLLLITLDASNSIALQNTNLATLTANKNLDFAFV